MDKENLGCCNMIIWDSLLIIILFTFGGFLPFHPVFRIGLGLLCAVVLFVLLNIPILGIILQLFCSYAWIDVIEAILPIEKWTSGNMVALWVCRIILFIFIFLFHYASFGLLQENILHKPFSPHIQKSTFDYDSYDSSKSTGNTYNYYEFHFHGDASDERNAESDSWQENSGNTRENTSEQQADPENSPEDDVMHPFHGCNDMESLKNRYKKLARAYHPDEPGGNAEAFQFIQSEYERLMKNFD